MPFPPRPKQPKGAGPYAGYSKNFKPTGSSIGTPAEKFVVDKVLGAGAKPQSLKVQGKDMPVKFVEAGVSGVAGNALRSGAQAAGRAAEKSLTQKVGQTISKETQDALKNAVKVETKTGKPPTIKPVKPLRDAYKTDTGFRRGVDAYERKVRAWNRANPDDQIKIAVPKDKPIGGKIEESVKSDVAKADAAKTKAEKATIKAGNRNAKTQESADKIERGFAKAEGRTAVTDLGKNLPSDVVPRFAKETGDLPKGITKDEIKKFASREVEATGKARPVARAKQASADLEESLKRGARLAEEGRKPGEDLPVSARQGSEGKFQPPAPSARQMKRDAAAAGLAKPVKPKNPGKAKFERSAGAKETYERALAQYEKDLAAWEKRMAKMDQKTKDINEGRRTATGELKGASKKSADRQERKAAKAEGKPVDKGTKFPKAKKEKAAPKQADAPAPKPTSAAPERPTFTPKPGSGNRANEIREAASGVKVNGKPAAKATAPKQAAPAAERPKFTPAKPSAASRADEIREATKGIKVNKTGEATKPKAAEAPKQADPAKPSGPTPAQSLARDLSKTKGKMEKGVKFGAGLATVGAAGAALDRKVQKMQADEAKAPKKPSDETRTDARRDRVLRDKRVAAAAERTKSGLRDKFGRKITREEFNRREAYRKKYGLDKMTAAQRAEWRKKNPGLAKAEEAKREKFRKTEGQKKFGKAAFTKTRNTGKGNRLLDDSARKALR